MSESRGNGDLLDGRWELDSILGRGAMGDVYRGFDRVLERPVAVKVLADDLLDDRIMRARFRQEAMSSSRLVHPNVVTTLDFGIDQQTPYIVMELVEGAPLDLVLAEQRRLDPLRAAALVRDVARGLDVAHRRCIIHRDIKPGNVMVTELDDREVARVMDFGIARTPMRGPRLTMVGTTVGTPGYIAPEQLAGGEVGPAADVFALGVVLYELLTGELPWPQTDPAALLSVAQRDRPRPLEALRPEVPAALRELCMSMIRRAVAERPAGAGVVAGRLQSFLDAARASESGPRVAADHARPVADAVLAIASLDVERRWASPQRSWYQRAVEDEGGTVTQSIGREVLAMLPDAEACLRLTRARPPADVPRPALAFHVGEVQHEEQTGMALGSGVRAVLRLARLAGPAEVLLTRELHEGLGLGWRGRLEPRGRFVLGAEARHDVFALRGTQAEAAADAAVEVHADGLHWRCGCGAHGRVPETPEPQMRVRCSRCSRLLSLDTREPPGEPDAPAGRDDHPLTSVVLTAVAPPEQPKAQVDRDLIEALFTRGEPEPRT